MISLPFDSAISEYDEQGYPIYDRASNSEELRTMLSKNFTDGVYPNPSTQFQVSTGTDMTVTVNPGACNIQGAFAYETNNRVLIVQAADTTYDRIDRVVLRLNTNTSYRNIDLYVIEGTPASTPVAPALSRTSGIWDIGLANLFIAKNTTSISASRITDTRLDKDVCGVVSGTIQSVDTSTIFAQYQAALNEYLKLVERAINDTEAGYLQDQISNVSADVSTLYSDLEATTGYLFDISGRVDSLNADKCGIIRTQTMSINITIPGNGSEMGTVDVDTMSGYEPAFIAGFTTSNIDVVPFDIRLIDNNTVIDWGFKNLKTQQANVRAKITVAYTKI